MQRIVLGYVGFNPFFVQDSRVIIVSDEGREQRKDLSDTQWAWEHQLDRQEYEKACGAKPSG